jgi:hypothetical protein
VSKNVPYVPLVGIQRMEDEEISQGYLTLWGEVYSIEAGT